MTETPHNPTLRELLDAVRPDSDDLTDADLSEAASAVEAFPGWRLLFENQQECDRQIAAAMQDVEFPAEAKQRLLDSLAADREASPAEAPQPSSEPSRPARRMNRRTWAYTATAAAGLTACVALGVLFFGGGPAALTLDEIRGQIPLAENGQIDVSHLPSFDDSFPWSLPTGRWEHVIFDNPVGLNWSGNSRHDAALLPFVTAGRRPIRGYLLIVPASAVASPPSTTVLTTATVSYFPAENTAWTDSTGTTVYLCFVEPGKLPALGRLLYPLSA